MDFVGVGSSPNVRIYQAKVGQLQQSGVYTVVVHAENMDGMALPVQTSITVSEPVLSGDINGDNSVNIFDFVSVGSSPISFMIPIEPFFVIQLSV